MDKNRSISTTYVPLQPPYQVIKYDRDVAMQIGTLIVTIQKDGEGDRKDYKIETHSHPVVAYENKQLDSMIDASLTNHQLMEGAVWNNVEIREVTTICLVGATLTWHEFLQVLEYGTFLTAYRKMPDVKLYWKLQKLGVKVLPPEGNKYVVNLRLFPQPEEMGLSLQTDELAPVFLNVSVAEEKFYPEPEEDDEEEENVDVESIVFWDEKERIWGSKEWKKQDEILYEIQSQLNDYSFIFRDLLFHQKRTGLNVTYQTDDKHFQQLVDLMNQTESFVKLAF